MHKLLILLLFIFVKSLPVFGQGFFISKYYSPKEYNSSTQIWDTEIDTNQVVFFGSGTGISIYNGVKWDQFHIGESGRGTSLFKSSKGEFFASGQYDFGTVIPDSLNRYSYHSISKDYYTSNERMNQHFSTFEFENSVYFYGGQGLEIYKDGKITKYPLDDINWSVAFLYKNRIFVNTNRGYYEFKNGDYVYVEESKVFENSNNIFATPTADGRILLGYTGKGLFFFDGRSFEQFTTELDDYLISSFIYDGVQLNDSTFAIATLDGGLVLLSSNGEVQYIYNKNTGFDLDGILNLKVDHEKNLWMGLWGGIEKVLTGVPIKKYSNNEGIETEIVDIELINDRIIIKYRNDIAIGKKSYPENTFRFKNLDAKNSFTKLKNLNDEIYVADSRGVFRLNKSDKLEEIYKGNILAFIDNIDHPEILTFLDSKSIITLQGNQIKKRTIAFPSDLNSIDEAILKDGILVAKRYSGIYQQKNDSLIQVPIRNDGNVRTIFNKLGVINNEIYVGVEAANKNGGLFKLDVDSSILVRSIFFGAIDEELVSEQVLEFEQCENGDVWFQNNLTVKRVRNINGEWILQKSPYQIIGEGYGIYSILCGSSKEVWFGGTEGLYQLKNPDWDYKTNFKTNITGIFVNNDSLIYGGYGDPTDDIILPYKDNQLRFSFSAASYIDSERNSYSTKLEGFDNGWSSWSKEPQKDYTNIPEGDYIFKVRSKNVFEVEGREDSIELTVLPPWYRTWWAYLVYLISIVAILYTAYKIRINQILKVERMRNRIAGDLHDEVSATLTGISYFAEAVKRDPNPDKKDHFMALITESAGDAKDKITDIVWSINPDNDNWELFLSKCRRFASDLLESKGLKYELKIVEDIPGKFNMELRQQLWLIFKEMVTNAVRHSEASRLDIIMDVEGNKLKLVVQDDGKGFDVETLKRGNGVNNIQKRAVAIKAEIELDSSVGFGTRWKMILPIG